MNYSFIKTPSGADMYKLELPGRTEFNFTFKDSSILHCKSLVESSIKDQNAVITNSFIFGGPDAAPGTTGINVIIRDKFCSKSEISSVQSFAISGTELTPVIFKGKNIGFVFENENFRECRLCGIVPENTFLARGEQARSVFNTIEEALRLFGFKFTDTVRTWFYNDHILDWYTEFNQIRTEFYNKTGIFGSLLPASTGIGAGNAAGAALCVNLLAIQTKNDKVTIREVLSPLQNPATSYRSSFSRAVKISEPGFEKLLISGTASIDKDGKTAHLDDPEKQIELTMDVVKAILESQGMDWSSIFRSIVYFTGKKFVPLFENYLNRNKIRRIPAAYAFADICRADLLFEIELDAVKLKV